MERCAECGVTIREGQRSYYIAQPAGDLDLLLFSSVGIVVCETCHQALGSPAVKKRPLVSQSPTDLTTTDPSPLATCDVCGKTIAPGRLTLDINKEDGGMGVACSDCYAKLERAIVERASLEEETRRAIRDSWSKKHSWSKEPVQMAILIIGVAIYLVIGFGFAWINSISFHTKSSVVEVKCPEFQQTDQAAIERKALIGLVGKLTISLCDDGPPGYQWQPLTISDATVMGETSASTIASTPQMKASMKTWSVEAGTAGYSTVSTSYSRPGEPPLWKVFVDVEVTIWQ